MNKPVANNFAHTAIAQKTAEDHFVSIAERYRIRILIGSSILITLALASLLLVVFFIGPLDVKVKLIITSIAGPIMVLCAVIPIIYQKTRALNFCSSAVIFACIFAIDYTISISGGPFVSTATYFVVIPSLLAFCLMGIRWGIFWTVSNFIIQWILISMDLSGHNYVNFSTEQSIRMGKMIDWSLSFIVMTSLIVIYEIIRQKTQDELDREKQKFEYLALHDTLTGLPNRKLFTESLSGSMHRARRHEKLVAMMLLDLDGFKPINDQYGHEAGDAILCHVSENISRVIRANDMAARLGGDEFAIVLEDIKEEDIPILADKILCTIKRPLYYQDNELSVSGSIGVSIYPGNVQDKDELIRQADSAMYLAKRQKQGWCLYT